MAATYITQKWLNGCHLYHVRSGVRLANSQVEKCGISTRLSTTTSTKLGDMRHSWWKYSWRAWWRYHIFPLLIDLYASIRPSRTRGRHFSQQPSSDAPLDLSHKSWVPSSPCTISWHGKAGPNTISSNTNGTTAPWRVACVGRYFR